MVAGLVRSLTDARRQHFLACPRLEQWRAWRIAAGGGRPSPPGGGRPAAGALALYEPEPAGRAAGAPVRDAPGAPGGAGGVLVAVESLSAPQRAAVLAPARALVEAGVPLVLLAPAECAGGLAAEGFRPLAQPSAPPAPARGTPPPAAPGRVWPGLERLGFRAVLATTYAGGAGALAFAAATRRRAAFVVAQHGVLTPFAAPLPPGALLLAWSEADASRWACGRDDVTWSVVGSQLLHAAAGHAGNHDTARACLPGNRGTGQGGAGLVFLGQLHGPELPRATTITTCEQLVRMRPLAYRPHPDETDARSLAQHRHLASLGIALDRRGGALAGTGRRPVVAVFSTGVLEAAAAGRHAYVACNDAPAWVHEVWERYAMSPLASGRPTLVRSPSREPARAVADAVAVLA